MLKETIFDFYKRLKQHHPDIEIPALSMDYNQPHFDIFDRSEVSRNFPMSFGHRTFYKITLLIGDGTVFLPEIKRKIQVKDRAFLIINPSTPYSWESKNKEIPRGFFCLFTDNFINHHDDIITKSLLKDVKNNPVLSISQNQEALFTDIFIKMTKEHNCDYIYKNDILRSYLHLIIHQVFKQLPIKASPKYDIASTRITNNFLELLGQQFSGHRSKQLPELKSAKDFADRLAVHVNHLNYAVKKVTMQTTSDHITKYMAVKAATLLRETNFDIAEISYQMGFTNPSNFNKFFKKHMNYTPKVYRMQNSFHLHKK